MSAIGADIEYDGGFVYSTFGDVFDAVTMRTRGTVPARGPVRPDAANARVHLLDGFTVRTFHYTALTEIGAFSDVRLAGHTRLIRWGTNGLAAGGGVTIVLLRGGQVAQ